MTAIDILLKPEECVRLLVGFKQGSDDKLDPASLGIPARLDPRSRKTAVSGLTDNRQHKPGGVSLGFHLNSPGYCFVR